jgi:hypothetical protein
MASDRKRILEMLAKGTITVDEAERLLRALGGGEPDTTNVQPTRRKGSAQYLHVRVEPKGESQAGKGERVNIRVPLQLIRAGMKLGTLLPEDAREKVGTALQEKGIQIDLNHLKAGDFEELMQALSELAIEVDGEDEHVSIYCE